MQTEFHGILEAVRDIIDGLARLGITLDKDMSEELTEKGSGITELSVRDKIQALEVEMLKQPGVMVGDCCPLVHRFAEGLYIRQITVPAGLLSVTKIHKFSHVTVLEKGTITVIEESGPRQIVAPAMWITPAMTKRAIYHNTEVVLTTIHSNPDNGTDIEKIEDRVIAKDFEDDGAIETGDFIKAAEGAICHG
jgi:hypothetical protein